MKKPGIQLGNRIWEDSNENGVQDAGEAGLQGLEINLYNNGGTLLATTTSDANGNYFFSKDGDAVQTWTTLGDSLQENTTYYLVFGAGQFSLGILNVGGNDYSLTQKGQTTTSLNPALVDSDAGVGDLLQPVFVQGLPFVKITSRSAGENISNLDVGFQPLATLPVEVISFTGIEKDCKIDLSWELGYAENFSEFEIEHWGPFQPRQTLASMSFEEGRSNYQFSGIRGLGVQNYFSLKLIDQDGSFEYTQPISIKLDCFDGFVYSLFPNPSTTGTDLTLQFNPESMPREIRMIDIMGNILFKEKNIDPMSAPSRALNTQGLLPGTYFIYIFDRRGNPYFEKFILNE
ncbi:MAG: hypothetical protein HKN16_06695 [Saprospiraceae bacterium]|nr:hypothetical protein [Saprospiraceae bacterium]